MDFNIKSFVFFFKRNYRKEVTSSAYKVMPLENLKFIHLGWSAAINLLFLQNAASANRISCSPLYGQELLYSPTVIP